VTDSVGNALRSARALAQRLMQSRVSIRRRTGELRNQETGQTEPTWATVYEGPARLRFTSAQPRDIDASGQRLTEQSPTVSLPIADDPRITLGASADVHVDDVGEVISNDPDPGVVGLGFRIAGRHDQTHSSARRLPVEVFSHG